jgi:hypothetical protein
MSLYNSKTTELPDRDAAKDCKNMFNIFHVKNINKINELKGEVVNSTLYSAKTNPVQWYAELYFIFWHLEEAYKCNS